MPRFLGFDQTNRVLGRRTANARLSTSLISTAVAPTDPFQSVLTAAQAAHLLRRTTFGPSPAQITAFTGLTAAQAVGQLLAPSPPPPPPLDPATGLPFHDLPFQQDVSGKLGGYLKSWWLGQMLNQPLPVVEKLTLFWSNHFVTTYAAVNDYRYTYQYYSLLRQHALGNFRTLVLAVTQHPAMLRYLNGNQNVVGKPNENYARELQELFTIGREGGYTEDDVRAAARVLTGWTDEGYRKETIAVPRTVFQPSKHDTGSKQFSAAYQNAVIAGRTGPDAGLLELQDLVNLLLAQPETARTICRELYRWLVNADVTRSVETNVIAPLAERFRQSNYEIRPVVELLLTSRHFFNDSVRGAVIKAPTDLVVGAWRHFGITAPDLAQDAAGFYRFGGYLRDRTREQQQHVFDPPTVFGWTAYYQSDYYQQWINSNTLGLRAFFTDELANGRFKSGGKAVFDPLLFVQALPAPGDPVRLVDDVTTPLLAVALTPAQKDFLIDQVLLDNLPRYEWTVEWNNSVQNPTNANTKAVRMKLAAFFQYLFRMAEFQLC